AGWTSPPSPCTRRTARSAPRCCTSTRRRPEGWRSTRSSGHARRDDSAAADVALGVGVHRADELARVEPALGQHDLARRSLAASRGAQLADGVRLVRVELGEQLVERPVGADATELVAHARAGREALEVPRDVLAELDAAA